LAAKILMVLSASIIFTLGVVHLVYTFWGPSSRPVTDEGARGVEFKLHARINRSDAETIRQALDQLAAKGSVRKEGDEFLVEAETEGASAKELNRTLLSALRRVEKRTTLRAEWSCGDTTEKFFDYVLKKTTKD
jgi:hypothetical protein